MQHKNLLKSKQALSPLIATIILISITISAGFAVYTLISSTLTTLNSTIDIHVQSIDIVKAGSNTLIAATIKNSGNTPIAACNLTLTGDSGATTLTLTNMAPGKTASTSLFNPPDLHLTVGNTYPISITAIAAENSLTKALTRPCTGT